MINVTKRLTKMFDQPVGPAILPGFQMLSDIITIPSAKTLTLTFPAKTLTGVVASSFDGTVITTTASITNNVATVTFTAAGACTFSYIIMSTISEVQTSPLVLTDDGTQALTNLAGTL